MQWCSEAFSLLSCFDCIERGHRQLRWAGQGEVEQAIFGASFLVHSPCCRGEQCCPREGSLDTQMTSEHFTSAPVSKEQSYSLSPLCAGLWLRLPVYPHLSLCRSPVAIELEVIGWDKGWLMSYAWLCLKWSRFVQSQPNSLFPGGSDPTRSR